MTTTVEDAVDGTDVPGHVTGVLPEAGDPDVGCLRESVTTMPPLLKGLEFSVEKGEPFIVV